MQFVNFLNSLIMPNPYRIAAAYFLLLVCIHSNALGYINNPDYYELSHSYRKMVVNWDLSNPKFIETTNQADNNYTSRVVNGAIELVSKTNNGIDWGVNLSKLDSICDWEIETRVKMDYGSSQDFIFFINGRVDTIVNLVGIYNNKRKVTIQSQFPNEVKKNDVQMYEWLQRDTSMTITIRKMGSRMMLFINYRFVGNFPPEFFKIPPHRFNWGLPQRNQKFYIYSFKVFRISAEYEKEFIETNPAARLTSYELLKQKVTIEDNLDDNRNNWTDQECKYNFSPTVNFSRGCIKIKEKPVRIDNVINPNGNFEVVAIVRKTTSTGRFVIGVNNCDFFGGFECALWANRVYSTYNPSYKVWFGVDNYQHYEKYIVPNDQIKYTIRKVDDIYYVFVDDEFTTAITNYPKIGTGISFVYAARGDVAMLDYIKVTEFK
jgi:hypothetical protein